MQRVITNENYFSVVELLDDVELQLGITLQQPHKGQRLHIRTKFYWVSFVDERRRTVFVSGVKQ